MHPHRFSILASLNSPPNPVYMYIFYIFQTNRVAPIAPVVPVSDASQRPQVKLSLIQVLIASDFVGVPFYYLVIFQQFVMPSSTSVPRPSVISKLQIPASVKKFLDGQIEANKEQITAPPQRRSNRIQDQQLQGNTVSYVTVYVFLHPCHTHTHTLTHTIIYTIASL